ncbi:MAG TPA: hypothetical protein VK675_03945 [Candidatus Paceibacterota bacterium]|nr:hypothetical protein [Candidatus Paceibacterota bacterium]
MKITPKTPITTKKKQKGRWGRHKWPSRPEVFEAFAEWIVYPKLVREPKTQQEFARLHEVSPDTLSDYKKKPEFWKKVEENRENLKRDIENKILLDKIVFPN